MKLYIANCTKYNQDFLFKTIEQVDNKSRFYTRKVIPIGCQVEVLEGSVEEVSCVIKQHLPYGLVAIDEIDRHKKFFGMCYSIDKPIAVEKIMNAMAHNEEEQEKNAHEQRKMMAATLSNSIDNNMVNTDGKLQSLEIEIVEQPKKGESPDKDKMTEVIQVVKPGTKAAGRAIERAASKGLIRA